MSDSSNRILARLRGLVVLVYCGLSMVAFFLLSLPVMILSGSGDLPIWLARKAWAPSCLWLSRCPRRARPLPDLPAGPLIFASNHESALDIWVLLAHLPRGFRFIAKEELFHIPVFGWYLRLGGHVPVDRRNRAQAVRSLHRAAQLVRAGTSLVVFPEGTRSRTLRIQPFKQGSFVLAAEAGVPIVPVAISGSGAATPSGLVAIWPHPIALAVGQPVHPRDHPDRREFVAAVRQRVVALHRELGGLGDAPAPAPLTAEGV
jgi:1-acyl-sn-glycerol-3-phosphate acyltransferase